jgi:hypothetical protein
MKTWSDFIAQFGAMPGTWTKKQWSMVATELLGERPRTKLGRPSKKNDPQMYSEHNYKALAFWAEERIREAKAKGKTLSLSDAVKAVMRAVAIGEYEQVRDVNSPPKPDANLETEEFRKNLAAINKKHKTAYTEVRKIRAKKNKAGKK